MSATSIQIYNTQINQLHSESKIQILQEQSFETIHCNIKNKKNKEPNSPHLTKSSITKLTERKFREKTNRQSADSVLKHTGEGQE